MQKLSDYMTISEASGYLGICSETLRRWDRSGKLKTLRHPLNGYRLYRKEQLDCLLSELTKGLCS